MARTTEHDYRNYRITNAEEETDTYMVSNICFDEILNIQTSVREKNERHYRSNKKRRRKQSLLGL